jgi:hypothetical protein
MNKFLALMIAIIVSAPVVGQSSRPIVFTGKIMDQDTRAPIPYVNMLVAGTYMGTSSDRSGSFVMKLAADYAHAEILVSCVGYQSKTIHLHASGKDQRIFLKKEVKTLAEYTNYGRQLSSAEILKRVFLNEHNVSEYHEALSYIRARGTHDADTLYNLDLVVKARYTREGVGLDILEKRDNLDDRKRKLQRENLNREIFANSMFMYLRPLWFHHFDIEKIEKHKGVTFDPATLSMYNDEVCFVIEYRFPEPKPKNTKSSHRKGIEVLNGTIIVRQSDFLLLQWTIVGKYNEEHAQKLADAGKAHYGISPLSYEHVRNYRIADGRSMLSYEGLFRKDIIIDTDLKQYKTSTAHECFIFNTTKTDGVYDINSTINSTFDPGNTAYHPEFWDNFNFSFYKEVPRE